MQHRCTICNKKFRSQEAYFNHTLHHEGATKRASCGVDDCTASFQNFAALRSHVSRCHKPPPAKHPTSASASSCVQTGCSALLNDRDALMEHVRDHLRRKEPVRCPHENCFSKLTTLGSFKNHLSLYHRNAEHVTEVTVVQGFDVPTAMNDSYENSTCAFPEEPLEPGCSNRSSLQEETTSEESHLPEDAYFAKTFALFLLKLEAKHLVPRAVVEEIVHDLKRLHGLSQQQLQTSLIEGIKHAESEEQRERVLYHNFLKDSLHSALSNESVFRSIHCRRKFYTESLLHVAPVTMSLGMGAANENRHYHYVPVAQTLESLLKDRTVADYLISTPIPRQDLVYADFTDGEVFAKQHGSSRHKLSLILYQDVFEVTNPLAPSRGTNKMLAVYFSLGNLPAFVRSQVDQQQLVLLCNEKDAKHFGIHSIFERLIQDLKTLEDEGISTTSCHYSVSLAFIAGDNLGSHFLGGFLENFSRGSHICRYCDVTLDAFRSGQSEGNLRTIQSYDYAVKKVEENPSLQHYEGVKKNSPFNRLSKFHVCMPGLPPCIGHDILEGIVDYDMALMINHLVIKLKWFTYFHLNTLIQSKFKYSAHDIKNKPSRVPPSGKSLGGNAMQNYTLLFLFPVIVGDKVLDASDDVWQLLLALQEIVELVMAPTISASQVCVLSLLIAHYIEERRKLFPDWLLRPKHHYLTHYPYLIRQFGPLIRTWTLRFESKHRFFKRCARASGNFINLTKSLAEKHQFLQTYLHCAGLCNPIVYYKELLPLPEMTSADSTQREVLQSFFRDLSGLFYAPVATIRGTCYKPGAYVLLGEEAYDPCFGEVKIIVANRDATPCLLVRKVHSMFLPNYRVYKLTYSPSSEFCVVFPTELCDTQTYSPYRLLGSLVIRLRSSIIWPGFPRHA